MKKKYTDLKFADLTEQDFEDLKAAHGDLNLVTITGDDAQLEASFIIKTPTRTVLDLVGHHGVRKDVLASNKTLISNCVVAGDFEVMEADGGIYSALLGQINKLIKTKEATVKKL